jgi:hypothetical protein
MERFFDVETVDDLNRSGKQFLAPYSISTVRRRQ